MARDFKKTPKTASRVIVRNNRSGMQKTVKKEKHDDEVPFKLVYLNPIDSLCYLKSILSCNITVDGKDTKKMLITPFRGDVVRNIKFKFGIDKFYLAEITILKVSGRAI